MADIEYHPLKPFLPKGGKLLFLGSFPPPRKRWCCEFFYPNYINDHWRLEGEVFYGDKLHFVDEEHKTYRLEEIKAHCEHYGIGFFDTAMAVRRLKDNASDKFLEVVVPTDIPSLLAQMPTCRAIVVTGEKAGETICRALDIPELPKVGHFVLIPDRTNEEGLPICIYRLPSSSRAYPLAFSKKAEAYKEMFKRFIDL